MENGQIFTVCAHTENYLDLKTGDIVLVRWEQDGHSKWYTCGVRAPTKGGCFAFNAGVEYYVDFDLDETICRPKSPIFDYIVRNPNCASLEIGNTKYLVPHEDLNFFQLISTLNALRVARGQQPSPLKNSWKEETVKSMAQIARFKRVVLAPLVVN